MRTESRLADTGDKYTKADAGCYVDGSRGIYAIDAIADIVRGHGMDLTDHQCDGCDHQMECGVYQQGDSWASCEFNGELEDECDDYMNEHHGVDGCYWGREESGDWGLWAIEDES